MKNSDHPNHFDAHLTPPRVQMSVTIIAKNEERCIAQAIRSVKWAQEVLVVDSGSTDRTVEIAKENGARVLHHLWMGYGRQKNYAQDQATYDWVLNIDADEYVPEPLGRQIQILLREIEKGQVKELGFEFPRKTFYLGRWIKHGGWYPNYLVRLAHRKHARWTEPQVHEQLKVNGPIRRIHEPLYHDAFPSISDQVLTNLRFAKLGSEDLLRKGQKPSLTKLVMKPIGKFFETFILKRGFLDRLPGFIISVNAAYSMFLKYAFLKEGLIREDSRHRQ